MSSFADKPSPESPSATDLPTSRSMAYQSKRWLVMDADGQMTRKMSNWMPTDEIVAVPDIYQVIGELGTQPPFDGVFFCFPTPDPQDLLAMIPAIRPLAPDSLFMAWLDAESIESMDLCRQAGFDRVLVEPLTKESLLAKLAPAAMDGDPAIASNLTTTIDRTTSPSSTASANRWMDQLMHLHPATGVMPSTQANPLGDLDLVEHLLQRAYGFSDLAVRLIQQQTGWSDVGFLPSDSMGSVPTACPIDHTSMPVEYQGQIMGMLHAPVPTEALTPWAIWLSRWLAMEAQTKCLWDFAFKDELTGAWNRRYFNRFLQDILDRATTQRFRVTLMVFDIDDFKQYNDRYGHAAGDEILRETARMIRSEVRKHDVVARIGGDEFAVIFWDANRPRRPNSEHPVDVRQAAQRFQQALKKHKFPKLAAEAPGTLTISGGLSSFPWDGRTPDELLAKADDMAMLSKKQGKNAITFGPGVMRLQDAN